MRLERPLATFRLHPASKTVEPSTAKAEDAARLADTFFTGPTFPSELRRHARRGRASYHLRAAFVYYQAARISRASSTSSAFRP